MRMRIGRLQKIATWVVTRLARTLRRLVYIVKKFLRIVIFQLKMPKQQI
jgi:hypothetical protein